MFQILDTHTLAGLMRETEPASNYWRSNFVGGNALYFDSEYIDFEKIPSKGRKLAPFVTPMDKGRLIKDKGSSLSRFKPAYMKPKHALDPTRLVKRMPGESLVTGSLSPQARANAILMEYMQDHRTMKDRRMEWLTFKAIADGKVTISGEDYPTQVVDFNRAANHTITKLSGSFWGQAGVSIWDDINDWVTRVGEAEFGGIVNRITMTPDVWKVFRKDAEIKELLNTNFRGGESTNLNTGAILGAAPAKQVGVLDGSIEVWVYNDWYEADDGTVTRFMGAGTVVLTSSALEVYECYGAIMDSKAGYQAVDIFTKMFEEDDPSRTFLLSQSAPLVVPVNPNCTLKAKVLA